MTLFVKEQRGTYADELLDLRNDYVFKSFFGDRRNVNLLLNFLNSILDIPIHSIELIDPHLERNHPNDKKPVMDVRVRTEDNEQINIEMQIQGHRAFTERMYMYMAKMYVSQDKEGKRYTEYRKAIQIIIANFELLQEDDFHNVYKITNQQTGSILTTHYEAHVLELPKLRKENVKGMTNLEKWLVFLKGDEQTKEVLAMENETMKEALEEVKRLSANPEKRRLAEFRERELKDIMQREDDAREDGIEQGIALGKEQRNRELVVNMYGRGFSMEDITQVTEIPLEKVMRIIKSIEQ